MIICRYEKYDQIFSILRARSLPAEFRTIPGGSEWEQAALAQCVREYAKERAQRVELLLLQ